MLVARTAERESVSEDGVFWWKEWRWADGWLQDRYLRRDAAGAVTAKEWQNWQPGATLAKAIREVIGDTSFFEAISLCPTHAREVEACKRHRAAAKARFEAEKRLKAAGEAIDAFMREETRLFNKRHGGKNPGEYDQARQRTMKRLAPRIKALKAEVVAARSHLDNLHDP